jgi:predicted benzoate:H+ symporter BenE
MFVERGLVRRDTGFACSRTVPGLHIPFEIKFVELLKMILLLPRLIYQILHSLNAALFRGSLFTIAVQANRSVSADYVLPKPTIFMFTQLFE